MSKDGKCECNCCLDPATATVLNASMARYNDRSAFANNMQQDSNVAMNSMFLAQAQNALEHTPQSQALSDAGHTANLAALIAAAKA